VYLAAFADHAWSISKAVPLLDIPDTLHWARPKIFSDSVIQSVLLLIIKISVVLPGIAYAALIFQEREENPLEDKDSVIAAIAKVQFAHPDWRINIKSEWAALCHATAIMLNSDGDSPPPDGKAWTAAAVHESVLVVLS
jgi:hypothetical protein